MPHAYNITLTLLCNIDLQGQCLLTVVILFCSYRSCYGNPSLFVKVHVHFVFLKLTAIHTPSVKIHDSRRTNNLFFP